jgi:3-oxoacyl-[acyl-carrier protein] reductase
VNLELDGARALVGGASRGLGRAVATALAGERAEVAIVGRGAERLEPVAAEIGGHAVVADLATPDGAQRAVEAAVGALGSLDLLLVNSGGPPPARRSTGSSPPTCSAPA